jgi:hypothetical protein
MVDSNTFPVAYTEPAIDLFWRASNHFLAWNSFHSMHNLRCTLKLNMTQILANIEDSPLLELTISLWNASRNTAGIAIRRQVVCNQETCKLQGPHYSKIPSRSRRDRLLCANFEFGAVEVFHVLVHPPSSRRPAELTLIAFQNGDPLKWTLDVGMLQHLTDEGFIATPDWSYIENNLTSKGAQEGEWCVQIPARVMIACYREWYEKDCIVTESMEDLRPG